jgi:hypothetical protein
VRGGVVLFDLERGKGEILRETFGDQPEGSVLLEGGLVVLVLIWIYL